MENRITKEKIQKYFSLTEKALTEARKNISKGKEKEAKEIIDMVSNYVSDSKYFREKKDFVNTFAALNYAHGWIDAGSRLGIFNVKDDSLFTVR